MKTPKRRFEKVKNEKFWKGFYTTTLLLGLISMVFEILIYRRTIINTYIPISIILFVGLLTFCFNRHHYNRTHLLTGNFFPMMQNLFSWGFLSCYVFMAANYYLAAEITISHKFEIKEKGSMSGSKGHRNERKPLITIEYFNFEKELVFRYEDADSVNKADSVMVTVKKGGLGFDVLDDYHVVR